MPVLDFTEKHKMSWSHYKTLAWEKISVLKGNGRYIAVTWYGEMTLPELWVSPSLGGSWQQQPCLFTFSVSPSLRPRLYPHYSCCCYAGLLMLLPEFTEGWYRHQYMCSDKTHVPGELFSCAVHCQMSMSGSMGALYLGWLSDVFVLTEYCL